MSKRRFGAARYLLTSEGRDLGAMVHRALGCALISRDDDRVLAHAEPADLQLAGHASSAGPGAIITLEHLAARLAAWLWRGGELAHRVGDGPEVLLVVQGYQGRQLHQEDVSTSSTDALRGVTRAR